MDHKASGGQGPDVATTLCKASAAAPRVGCGGPRTRGGSWQLEEEVEIKGLAAGSRAMPGSVFLEWREREMRSQEPPWGQWSPGSASENEARL